MLTEQPCSRTQTVEGLATCDASAFFDVSMEEWSSAERE